MANHIRLRKSEFKTMNVDKVSELFSTIGNEGWLIGSLVYKGFSERGFSLPTLKNFQGFLMIFLNFKDSLRFLRIFLSFWELIFSDFLWIWEFSKRHFLTKIFLNGIFFKRFLFDFYGFSFRVLKIFFNILWFLRIFLQF